VPCGTDITNLTPTIVHTGVSVNPESEETVEFTDPVIYTVTAEDSSTKEYTVTVSAALSSAKDITQFTILGISGIIGTSTIALTVPYVTDVTDLTPTITITGASVSPVSGVPQNFTSPVTYTVTAADVSTKVYTWMEKDI
jgi:methionine synthase I (cobalamin-dependent)